MCHGQTRDRNDSNWICVESDTRAVEVAFNFGGQNTHTHSNNKMSPQLISSAKHGKEQKF